MQENKDNRGEVLLVCQQKTVYHGAICFALGLLSGIPYTGVILREYTKDWSAGEQNALIGTAIYNLALKTGGTERAWKMAHMEGLLNGMSMFLVAAIMPVLTKLSGDELRSLTAAMLVTGYGNSVASIFCAAASVRGMVQAGSLMNRAGNLGFTVAVVTITRAVFLLMKGTGRG
mmetsp:Transcript_11386/g.22276  ORF Transcript_11386/g.22276 Transcript_11386/m.22276 type:complete len:174 (+) Transcript_11386:92-613(+)